MFEHEETTTTTETTTQEEFQVVGELTRQKEHGQFFVKDPADKSKVWLNDKDEFYEDAEDKIWKLV